MTHHPHHKLLRILTLAALTACAAVATAQAQSARDIHESLIVMDTHFDTPANLGRPGWSIMDRHSTALDGDQVDYPRMVEGGVDGAFFVVYTPSGPRTAEATRKDRDFALRRAVQVREMIAKHSQHFALAITADDAQKILQQGKRFVYLSMENSAPVQGDLSLMSQFRSLGVTMMSPVHFSNNELGDSATDKPEWKGLSPKGREFVTEGNRLGIVLDASHASDDVLRQMVAQSKAPIILSHSGMRAIYDHPRNVSDADAKLVAAKGGVIQINVYNGYMIAQPTIAERSEALRALRATYGRPDSLNAEQKRAIIAKRQEIDARWPVPRANFDDFMKHLNHAIKLVGIDHVGISGDFDGGGGVDDLNDITDYPRITEAMLKAGYKPADIGKFWSGNALRVLRDAQALAEPGAVAVIPVTR